MSERATVDFMGQPVMNPKFDHAVDGYPFAVYWPDGAAAGRYSHALAAHIKAELIGGTYRHEPRAEEITK